MIRHNHISNNFTFFLFKLVKPFINFRVKVQYFKQIHPIQTGKGAKEYYIIFSLKSSDSHIQRYEMLIVSCTHNPL